MKTRLLLFVNLFIVLTLIIPLGLLPTSAWQTPLAENETPQAALLPPPPPQAGQATYTISGTVTDNGGSPVTGVVIEAKPVAPTPIVFVHGIRSLPPNTQLIGCTEADRTRPTDPAEIDAYFGKLDDTLAQYYPVFYARLVSNSCYTPSLATNARYLRDSINDAKAQTGADKVILIAHSMGGLVSRAYVESSLYQYDVEKLITLGSPHQGAPSDVLLFLMASGWPGVTTLGAICLDKYPALCEFSFTGMIAFNNQYSTRRSGVAYYAISGDAPWNTRNLLGKATDVLIPFGDDGIVPQWSGVGLSGPVITFQTDENHNAFGNNQYNWTYFSHQSPGLPLNDSRSYTECIQKILVDSPAGNCGQSGLRYAATNDVGSQLSQHTPVFYETLLPGATLTHTFSIGAGPAIFATQWATGTVGVSLVNPNGTVIDAGYAAANPTVVTYTVEANMAAYEFPSAAAGTWKLVQTDAGVPVTGTNTSSFASYSSNLSISGGTDSFYYQPGATAVITASLQGQVVDSANITATVTYADNSTTDVTLANAGGGVYQATHPISNIPGYAQIRFSAVVISGGDTVDLGTSATFQVSPVSLVLSGSYQETPQPRSGSSSFYDSLDISVGVTAAYSGTYGLSGDLVDSQGDFVAHAVTSSSLVTGTGAITLTFTAADIYASGLNGPYSLTKLLLTDE
ncbi:MAG: alpha/beta fold hydrolase, partial [Chloroflexi bacterium]